MRVALLAVALVVCGCQNMPAPYAPPVQRPLFEDYHPRMVRVVDMVDPDAHLKFAQDFFDQPGGSWRWTGKRPTVKLKLRSNENLKYTIDFTVPGVTFKETGPVTISFFVNDHKVDEVRYETTGVKHFEKPIPADWVIPGQDTTVGAEIDKTWVAKDDGAILGLIISRIGLTQ
jgi:hypothetical protein